MLSISSILDMLVSLKINSTIELFSLYCVTVSLLLKFLIVDNRGSIVTCRTYSLSAVYMGVGSMSNRPNGDAIVSERVALMSEGSEIASPFQIKSDNLKILLKQSPSRLLILYFDSYIFYRLCCSVYKKFPL